MKRLTGLLPLATGIALVGALTWSLLDRNIGAGRWLLAALLLFHGWVHVMFLFPRPDVTAGAADADADTWPFDLSRSWLVRAGGLDAGRVRIVGMILVATVVAGFALTALATVGVLVPADWWTALILGSAVASGVLLGICFSATLLLGFAIDGAVAWLALGSIWSPVLTRGGLS